MPRTPSVVTQADIARAIRAAEAAGWERVRITKTGDILIEKTPDIHSEPPKEPEPEPLEVI